MKQMSNQESQFSWSLVVVCLVGLIGLVLLCNSQAPFRELWDYHQLPAEYRGIQQEACQAGMTFEGATQYAWLYSREYPEYMRQKEAYEKGEIPYHPPEPTTPIEFAKFHPQYAQYDDLIDER